MSEDEAFIRKIVDSPGDDLPRLVYADWLDERDDPRGAYLRAEAEWAKTKQTTGFLVLRLHGLADGLDPVWVARVSRPPEGVCCDHLARIMSDERGPRRTLADFQTEDEDGDAVDSAVGWDFRVPYEYIAFLLNRNGFSVQATRDVRFSTGNLRDELWLDEFHCVFGTGHNESSLLGSAELNSDPFNPGCQLISIASVFDRHEAPSALLLGTHESCANRVFVWNSFGDNFDDEINPDNVIQVADSLGGFLNLLRVA